MVPSVHKELSSTVECILSNTVSEIKCSSNDSDIIQSTLILDNVNTKSLSIFLKQFAPFQLFRDRPKTRKLCLPRKNFDVLLYLHTTQHNTTQHNKIQHRTKKHNTKQHNTKQQNTTTKHNISQHNIPQYTTTQHYITQHITS